MESNYSNTQKQKCFQIDTGAYERHRVINTHNVN